jgi:hypothetical protein
MPVSNVEVARNDRGGCAAGACPTVPVTVSGCQLRLGLSVITTYKDLCIHMYRESAEENLAELSVK